jgi:hypothetical protein
MELHRLIAEKREGRSMGGMESMKRDSNSGLAACRKRPG